MKKCIEVSSRLSPARDCERQLQSNAQIHAEMDEKDELLDLTTPFDIRVEALAARIASARADSAEGFDIDQIVVAPQGGSRRRSNHEVKSARKRYYDDEVVIQLETHRKGLFDTLPGALFLSANDSYANPRERTKAIEQQIKEARRFFLPFEQAIYHPRIFIEQIEQEWTEHFPDFVPVIWGLDEFSDCLSASQKFLLCYLIPEAYRIAGDWELTALCFGAVLKKTVSLKLVPPVEHPIPEHLRDDKELRLGENTLLGEAFQDDLPALHVIIQDVTAPELPEFLQGGKSLRILEQLLYSYFLPLETTVITEIRMNADAWGNQLGSSYLGFNFQVLANE